jgi:peroxiredoxin Q/BCP
MHLSGGLMSKRNEFLSLLLVALIAVATPAAAQELRVGGAAPDFSLKASDGKTYTLSGLKGKTVVLAWFPKAFTSG